MRLGITNKINLSAALVLLALSINVYADTPATSGIVTRFESPFALTWVDERTGYRVALGISPAEFCMGGGSWDIVELSKVNIDFINEFSRYIFLMHGYVRAFVYDFTSFDCARFTTEEPVASGYATVISADNDVPGLEPGEPNANAFGWAAYGELESAAGNPAHLSAQLRGAWNISNDVHVQLTQIVMLQVTN